MKANNTSSRFQNHYSRTGQNGMRFLFPDGGESNRREVQWEMERQYGPKHDPNGPPPKERGDKYIAICILIGVIIFGALAWFSGVMLSWATLTIIFAMVGGVVIGGIIGAITGDRLKKSAANKTLKPG